MDIQKLYDLEKAKKLLEKHGLLDAKQKTVIEVEKVKEKKKK